MSFFTTLISAVLGRSQARQAAGSTVEAADVGLEMSIDRTRSASKSLACSVGSGSGVGHGEAGHGCKDEPLAGSLGGSDGQQDASVREKEADAGPFEALAPEALDKHGQVDALSNKATDAEAVRQDGEEQAEEAPPCHACAFEQGRRAIMGDDYSTETEEEGEFDNTRELRRAQEREMLRNRPPDSDEWSDCSSLSSRGIEDEDEDEDEEEEEEEDEEEVSYGGFEGEEEEEDEEEEGGGEERSYAGVVEEAEEEVVNEGGVAKEANEGGVAVTTERGVPAPVGWIAGEMWHCRTDAERLTHVRSLREPSQPRLTKAASGAVRVKEGGRFRTTDYTAYSFILRHQGVDHVFGVRWSHAVELERALGLNMPGFGSQGGAFKAAGLKVLTALKPTDPYLVAWRYERVAALLAAVVARPELWGHPTVRYVLGLDVLDAAIADKKAGAVVGGGVQGA